MASNGKKHHLVIVGGGATGAIALVKMLERFNESVQVTMIEPAETLGRGRAFSTNEEHHVLNVPVERMSVSRKDPLDFLNWVRQNEKIPLKFWPFVPRHFFGEYLQEKVSRIPSHQFNHLRTEIVSMKYTFQHWSLTTADDKTISCDWLVLATGYQKSVASELLHFLDDSAPASVVQPYDFETLSKIGPKDDVLIVGTGLTATDVFMHLHEKTSGKIHMISRHGLTPQPHLDVAEKNPDHLPNLAGLSPLQILNIFRKFQKASESHWVSLVNQVREQASSIWVCWSAPEKRRFLRHLKSYWEVVRHRLPRPVFDALLQKRMRGDLNVHTGRITSTQKVGDDVVVSYQQRGQTDRQEIRVRWIVLATDAKIDQRLSSNSPAATLKKCELGLGYVNDGSPRLSILGPASKSKCWEITSIPDIVKQVDECVDAVAQEWASDSYQSCFTHHPTEIEETYRQHFGVASAYAFALFKDAAILAVHAVFPFLYSNHASERIRRLFYRFQRRRLAQFKRSKITNTVEVIQAAEKTNKAA